MDDAMRSYARSDVVPETEISNLPVFVAAETHRRRAGTRARAERPSARSLGITLAS